MTTDIEARVSRKIMLRILPFVMLLYFVSFLDRVNVGFAALTMNKAIGLSPTAFGFGGGIFFLGYFLFEVPSNLILHRVGARIWIARVMVTWGIVSAASAFVIGPNSFLRSAVSARGCGSRFFPRHHSLFEPLVSGTAARSGRRLVHGGSAHLDGDRLADIGRDHADALDCRLADWQLLYIIEAVPAIILGFVVLKYMTDAPAQAHWLQPDERAWLAATLQAEAQANKSNAGHSTGAWRALRDPRVLVLALIYFGTSAGLYTLGLWAPQIIRQFGFTSWQTGLLNAIPSVIAVAGYDRLGASFRSQGRAYLARRHSLRTRVSGLCAGRPGPDGAMGDRGADCRQSGDQCGEGAALGDAYDVPVGRRCCGGYRDDQCDWECRRVCRSVRDRLDQG